MMWPAIVASAASSPNETTTPLCIVPWIPVGPGIPPAMPRVPMPSLM